MSIKCTIAHDSSFHFYHEVLDDDHVYLELRMTHFEAGYGRVMIPIPIHIWETIRRLGGVRLDLVEKQDSELLAMVEAEVDERIAQYEAVERDHPDRSRFVRLLGRIPYGAADTPRAEQRRRGVDYFQSERAAAHNQTADIRSTEGQLRSTVLRSVCLVKKNGR